MSNPRAQAIDRAIDALAKVDTDLHGESPDGGDPSRGNPRGMTPGESPGKNAQSGPSGGGW